MQWTSSRTWLHSIGAIIASRDEELKILTQGDAGTCGIHTPGCCVRFLFIKTAGNVSGVVADEGATCLVLVDVDTGYLKAAPTSAKTITEGGRRFIIEKFSRKRVTLALRRRTGHGGAGSPIEDDLVVLERTPRHDSPANPAERAVRTLEEVMRLDFEKRTGTELLANSCF